MNLEFRVVIRQLGLLTCVLSTVLGLVAIFAAVDRLLGPAADGADFKALLLSAVAGLAFGALMYVVGRPTPDLIGQREALLVVAAGWLLGAGVSALPYRMWAIFRQDAGAVPHAFDSAVNCYFEAMSGLTTTGATVVQVIDTLPRSLLLWRSLTHWLGGLGIVVLFVAVFPLLGVGGRRVYRIEAPGPSPEGVKPRIQDTARILWMIYVSLTIAEAVALRLCGMTWFDATCHTFATLATGGFSTQDAGIAAYPSMAIQGVIIVFMVLAGVNFGLYHRLLQRQWRTVIKDPELRVYLAIIVVATVIVGFSLLQYGSDVATLSAAAKAAAHPEPTAGGVLRESVFQVVSIQTTTGFCSTDSDQWGFAAKATLLILMFIGASAGSTGGGIKVVRIMIFVKVILAEIEHMYRPSVVRPLKIGKNPIDADLKLNTLVYVAGIVLLFAVGTVLLMLFESGSDIDITSAATASAATLNNIGPGLARVGATQNYAWFTAPSKVLMSTLMLLGRLEMFTVVVLFSPRFWRAE